MRVLMVGNGRVVHAQRPLEWLLRHHVDVLFLDTASDPEVTRKARCTRRAFPHPIRSYRVRQLGNWLGDWLPNSVNPLFYPQAWASLRREAADFAAELAHVHWIDREAYHVAKAGIRPLILSAWGSDINRLFVESNDPAIPRLRQQVSFALRCCDHLITDAPDLVERSEQLAGRALDHTLLPLGIETRRFSRDLTAQRRQWRDQLSVPSAAFLFGSFREMRPHYGHHHILEAFARVKPHADAIPYLLFKQYYSEDVNRTPEYEQRIRARAVELGIEERVRWVSQVPHSALPELYSTVDALINYPERDGFPVHFLEAAASKRPVISCRQPAYEWGFAAESFDFVQLGEVGELAGAMQRLINGSPESVTRLEYAFEAVSRKYDESVTAAALLDVYRHVTR